MSRQWIIALSASGIVFCIGVHLYLLRAFSVSQYAFKNTSANALIENVVPRSSRQLTELREIDRRQYTIRINTWQRLEQLKASIHHHVTCPGVAAIQVVWCNEQGEPPDFLYEYELVHVERHDVNTLNERFHITDEPPTLGILSMDDDVLRSCEAIDAGFFKWVRNPDRMVGFDARSHVVDEKTGVWSYAYLSTTDKTNRYSLTLPRYAFLHRDYMDQYMTEMSPRIFQMVAKNFNCEDIAMSFFVSSLTNGKPPLLADYWAMKSMVKLYSEKKISGSGVHKALRDECVETFAQLLDLKTRLKANKLVHEKHVMFECGADDKEERNVHAASERQDALYAKVSGWKKISPKELMKELGIMKKAIGKKAYEMGLIEHSKPFLKTNKMVGWRRNNRCPSPLAPCLLLLQTIRRTFCSL